jgi:feruloyl esterase
LTDKILEASTMHRSTVFAAVLAASGLWGFEADAADAAACAAIASPVNAAPLAALTDAPTTILSARIVAAERDVPEHCRVEAQVSPTVGVLVKLPTTNWNGKFIEIGCGGPCGRYSLESTEPPLIRGYATAVSDMGHKGNEWGWAYNNAPAQLDFGFRATHVTAVAGKAITEAFYGKAASRSYYSGCSTGGRQGMVSAQRFPYDFDGIVAGAPVLNQTGVRALFLVWNARANIGPDRKPILAPDHLKVVRDAVMAACDGKDRLKDGLLQDPRACTWQPKEIECRGGSTDRCLTAAQVAVVERIYNGAATSEGRSLFPGMPRGSELSWTPDFIGRDGRVGDRLGNADGVSQSSINYLAFFYSPGPAYSAFDFDYDRDPPRLGLTEYVFNAQNPDLRAFKARGGKLIHYHGWDDNQIPAALSIDYYETVTRTMGGREATRDFYRLFALPAMNHCHTGIGASEADWLGALEAWVERGQAPDLVLAYKARAEGFAGAGRSFPQVTSATGETYLRLPRFPNDEQSYDVAAPRPVYAYPDVAVYSGSGDVNDPKRWRRAR